MIILLLTMLSLMSFYLSSASMLLLINEFLNQFTFELVNL